MINTKFYILKNIPELKTFESNWKETKKKTLINRVLNFFYHLKSQLQLKHVTHNTENLEETKKKQYFRRLESLHFV